MSNRERLPDRRKGWVQKVRIGGQKFYLRVGLYEDGRLGEIFLDTHKEGSFSRGMMQSLAMMTSLALQSGVPVEEVVAILRHINFPPNGAVEGSANVKVCSSVPDYIAQELAAAFPEKGGRTNNVELITRDDGTQTARVVGETKPFDGTYPMPEDKGSLDLTDHAVEKEGGNT